MSSVGCTIIINGDYIEVGNSPSRMCVYGPLSLNWIMTIRHSVDPTQHRRRPEIGGRFSSIPKEEHCIFGFHSSTLYISRTIKQQKFILKGHFDCVCRMTQSE